MEFVSLGAYQFGKSLSKMVPLIDLGSRTAIQVFCQISLQKKLKHIPKNVKSLKHFHHTERARTKIDHRQKFY